VGGQVAAKRSPTARPRQTGAPRGRRKTNKGDVAHSEYFFVQLFDGLKIQHMIRTHLETRRTLTAVFYHSIFACTLKGIA